MRSGMSHVGRRRARLVLAASLLAAGLACQPSGPAEDGIARYALCKQNVASVSVLPGGPGGGAGLGVQLTRAATREFQALTEAHAGDTVEVVFADRLFLSATVRSRIRSGLLVNSGFEDEAHALAAGAELSERLSAGPCGSTL